MKIKTAHKFIIFFSLLLLSGCKYINPFLQFRDASEFKEKGKYVESIPLFESAIKGFSIVSAYEEFEYDARCEYALTLNETGYSNHIFTARENFDLVLAYIGEGNKLARCSEGVVMSSRANTFQREAAYAQNDDKYYELLEQAYALYKEAIQPLKRPGNQLSLAYNYFNLAETSEMSGDISEAIKWIEKAIEVNNKYGFSDNLVEDSNYLIQLKAKKENQHNHKNDDGGKSNPDPVDS